MAARHPSHHPVEAARSAHKIAVDAEALVKQKLEAAIADPKVPESRVEVMKRRYQKRVDLLAQAEKDKAKAEEDWTAFKKERAEKKKAVQKAAQAAAQKAAQKASTKASTKTTSTKTSSTKK